MLVIPALRRWGQENQNFKDILSYVAQGLRETLAQPINLEVGKRTQRLLITLSLEKHTYSIISPTGLGGGHCSQGLCSSEGKQPHLHVNSDHASLPTCSPKHPRLTEQVTSGSWPGPLTPTPVWDQSSLFFSSSPTKVNFACF